MTNQSNTPRIVLVTGVTGQQGGAVAKALLAAGHKVRGLTRDANTDKARALVARGIEVVSGDFTNQESLESAARGVDTVFAMTTPFETGVGAETQQGLTLLAAVKSAGVGHLIFSSVANADQQTGIPHFDSKFEVEKAIVASGLNHTIVAPVFFMDNFLAPWLASTLGDGKLSMAMPGDRALQQIAVEDIGSFVAAIVDRRETVFGKRFDIAGDEVTPDAAASALSSALGREVAYHGFPPDAMREHSEDMAIMFEWFDKTGYSANPAGLRKDFPEVGWATFGEWAADQNWSAVAVG